MAKFNWNFITKKKVSKPEHHCPNCKWAGLKNEMKPYIETVFGGETYEKLACPKCGLFSGRTRVKEEILTSPIFEDFDIFAMN